MIMHLLRNNISTNLINILGKYVRRTFFYARARFLTFFCVYLLNNN